MSNQRQFEDQWGGFQLRLPQPKQITAQEELNLLSLATSSNPGSPELRFRLASSLFGLDRFDQAVDLLRGLVAEIPEFRVLHQLALALLARETEADTLAARDYALSGLAVAGNKFERSGMLALLGKVCLRMGRFDEGRSRLLEALDENLANKDAYKRLAMLDFQQGRIEEALEFATRMIARQAGHCRVLAVVAMALAKLGRMAEAREVCGLDRFLHQVVPLAPPGWSSIEDFNRELADELLNHPGLRRERYGTASTRSWRVDDPVLVRSRRVRELWALISREVKTYVAGLPEGDHPWLLDKPADTLLRGWSVMTDGDGFEEWHVHQSGWLSCAYYVHVPDFIVQGRGPEGCIAFGIPSGIVGEDCSNEFGQKLLRPYTGLLLLFPSHAFHRTFPHKGDRRRICSAFDVVPLVSPD